MSFKVLLVDDDPTLLSSLSRMLSRTYDVTLAGSGAEALARLHEAPHPVVVTDMRMPGMNGLELIEAARAVAPDASYLMLTGNNDQQTAIDAVNRGRVYQFLTKPCGVEDLVDAINQAHRAYELLQAEKCLLSKTLAGAVGLLVDVLEANRPGIGLHLARLGATTETLRAAIDMPPSWELTVASRLALVGMSCLGDTMAKTFFGANPATDPWRRVLTKATGVSARLVRRVPRLESVSRIIELIPATRGGCHEAREMGADPIVVVGATVLHTSILWNAIEWQGLRPAEVIGETRSLLPDLQQRFVDGLRHLSPSEDNRPAVVAHPEDLEPGMVLHADVVSSEGTTLLRAGSRLTGALIEKLRDLAAHPGGPEQIEIIDPDSLATHVPASAAAAC